MSIRRMDNRTYSAESFDLSDMVSQDWRLLSCVETIKFGNVVHLNIVLDSIGNSR